MSSSVIVIPTYNEFESLSTLLEKLLETEFHILIVDDNSPDGTGELANSFATAHPKIDVLHRVSKEGLGNAYKAGFRHCLEGGFSWIIEMDADGSHRVEDLILMKKYVEANPNIDLLIGSRWIPGGSTFGWSFSRKLLSKTANKLAKTLLGSQLSDLTSGFRIMSRDAAQKIVTSKVSAKGYGFQIESAVLLERSGFKLGQIPIKFLEREEGQSKMSKAIILEAFLLLVRLSLTRKGR